jgi:2,4-dienoyl-CoA reductase (NADPH2)
MNQLQKLFEPIRLGNMELPNRIKFPAMTTNYATGGKVTNQLRNFLRVRAEGGAGLIGVPAPPHPLSEIIPMIGSGDDKYIPELRELAEICRSGGAKVYGQVTVVYLWVFRSGRVAWVSPSGVTATGRLRSPFGPMGKEGQGPEALTIDEIHEIVDSIGDGVCRIREAGFDAAEILVGPGYILSQFLSPLTNKRNDQYGGNLENRMRIILEAIESAKKKAGSDYTLMVRISSQFAPGGYTLEDLKVVAAAMEKAGIKGFDVAAGWHDDEVEMLQSWVPQGSWAYVGEEIKKTVSSPVATGVQIADPFVAEQVIAQGKTDMVFMGRALIADPELPKKAKEGRFDEIRPCIACNECFARELQGLACTVNPRLGSEGEHAVEPAPKRKKVFVIGGGPAGMEAASTAAQRGHQVTLFEKSRDLGGAMLIASQSPYKKDRLGKLIQYQVGELDRNGVHVRLGVEADIKLIVKGKPDVVILASGGVSIIPDIPGVEKSNVVSALDVLTGSKKVDDTVVIIGGGKIGCETADLLSESGKKITILEMLNRVGSDINRMARWPLMRRLKSREVRIETSVKVKEITDRGVRYADRDGTVEFFEANSIILAVGLRPNNELAERLQGKVVELHSIGDCVEVRQILEAIDDGFSVAKDI